MGNFCTEIDVISQYPKQLSEEMVILMRRITYLKLMMSETNQSQYQVLDDVSEFDDFIYNLMVTKRTTPLDFVKTYFPYEFENNVEEE
jgi:hypothetical protein